MIFVTSGHVDHGKTSLLQALTGTHTAHLPDEKKRGLTIDLGYAYLPIEGDILGFIDVPGHQKFLSNMLAGLGGIKHALLIVAADEGIKPQTVEHLEILKLLQFKKITVVITKADKANETIIANLTEQLKSQFPFLANSPFFATSVVTQQGIKELTAYLIEQSRQNQHNNQPFRYAIDRVFNVKGTGLVVTGTAVAGQIKIGDEFYLSNGEKVRVKGIHAQNSEAQVGLANQRLALNIAGVEKEQVKRGDWITELNPQYATERITVKLLANQNLKESSVIHLYHFASHITGKLNLLTTKQAVKNTQNFAEIILDEPLHIAIADKLIIRSGDDSQTLAGAEVIEIDSPRRYKRSEARLKYVTQLALCTNSEQRLALMLQDNVVEREKYLWAEQQFNDNLTGDWLFSEKYKSQIQQTVLEKITEYHEYHQDQLGVTKARLYRITTLNLPEKLAYQFIDELIENKYLMQTRGWIHSPNHRIEFNAQEQQIWQQIKPLFEQSKEALWVRDIATALSADETEMRNLLYKAGKLGYLIPIVKDRFLSNEQIAEFAQLIKKMILEKGDISVNQLRDEIGYGRKLTVQLIEYFDRSGFLRRKGNVHLLRDVETF